MDCFGEREGDGDEVWVSLCFCQGEKERGIKSDCDKKRGIESDCDKERGIESDCEKERGIMLAVERDRE